MNFTSALDDRTAYLLQIENFKRKKNVYLRIYGDGILQCVFAVREPHTRSLQWNIRNEQEINVSIRSLYEPDVFGDTRIYRGALTYPYDVRDFNLKKTVYPSSVELFAEECLPKLNKTATQQGLCELITQLDLGRYGTIRWYMDMLTIPALMAMEEYAFALQKCENALTRNSALPYVLQMRELLLRGDSGLINNYLAEQREKNMATYSSLNFR